MVKSKRKTSSSKKVIIKHTVPLALLFIALFAFVAVLLVAVFKQADTISKYELLEKIDNQACRYLDGQREVNGGFDLNTHAPTDTPKLSYICLTGEATQAKDIQGKFIDQYSLGATVLYFSTEAEAYSYAENKLNPLRYWGVDTGETQSITQNAKFTFVVSDEKIPYFDAYTVKANAVLRVSLPCGDSGTTVDLANCDKTAKDILDRELKGINVL